jgi:hypothetical protein
MELMAIALLLGIALVTAVFLMVGGDEEHRARQRMQALNGIARAAEQEMDRAAARHHAFLDELKRRHPS